MTDDPRWHGWATPENVRQMMIGMFIFLEENRESCPFTIAPVPNVEMLKKIFGPEWKKFTQIARNAGRKWSGYYHQPA